MVLVTFKFKELEFTIVTLSVYKIVHCTFFGSTHEQTCSIVLRDKIFMNET